MLVGICTTANTAATRGGTGALPNFVLMKEGVTRCVCDGRAFVPQPPPKEELPGGVGGKHPTASGSRLLADIAND